MSVVNKLPPTHKLVIRTHWVLWDIMYAIPTYTNNFWLKIESDVNCNWNFLPSAGSRPWYKGGGGRSSRLLHKGGARSPKKNFFWPFGPQFGLKISRPGPLPWFRHFLGSISAALSRSSPRRDCSGEERELISRTATGIWANLYP